MPRQYLLLILLFCFLLVLPACQRKVASEKSSVDFLAESWGLHFVEDFHEPLRGKGLHGEEPVSPLLLLEESMPLWEERFPELRIAVAMQDLTNDWARLQMQGIHDVLGHFDAQVIVVTDAEFSLHKQLFHYQHIALLQPDMLITLPLDAEETAPVLKEMADDGVRLVFIDNVPNGFVFPDDYAGFVMADSYANGMLSMQYLLSSMDKKNPLILVCRWSNRVFTTEQRTRGALDYLQEQDEVNVIEMYFDGIHDVRNRVATYFSQFPAIDGIWVVWDAPAREILDFLINEQREQVKLVTNDLSRDMLPYLTRNNQLLGLSTQHPYQQGVAVALLAILNHAEQVTHPLVLMPGAMVTPSNFTFADSLVFYHTYQTP